MKSHNKPNYKKLSVGFITKNTVIPVEPCAKTWNPVIIIMKLNII